MCEIICNAIFNSANKWKNAQIKVNGFKTLKIKAE